MTVYQLRSPLPSAPHAVAARYGLNSEGGVVRPAAEPAPAPQTQGGDTRPTTDRRRPTRIPPPACIAPPTDAGVVPLPEVAYLMSIPFQAVAHAELSDLLRGMAAAWPTITTKRAVRFGMELQRAIGGLSRADQVRIIAALELHFPEETPVEKPAQKL